MCGQTGEDRHNPLLEYYTLNLIPSPCIFFNPIGEGMANEDIGSSVPHYLFPVVTLQPTKKIPKKDNLFSTDHNSIPIQMKF